MNLIVIEIVLVFLGILNEVQAADTSDSSVSVQVQIYIVAGVLGGIGLLLTILCIVLLVSVNSLTKQVDQLKFAGRNIGIGAKDAFGSRHLLPEEETSRRFQQFEGSENRYDEGPTQLPRATTSGNNGYNNAAYQPDRRSERRSGPSYQY